MKKKRTVMSYGSYVLQHLEKGIYNYKSYISFEVT